MVNEPGFDEAVKLAKENPRLGIGLHLTLLMGIPRCRRKKFPASSIRAANFSNPVGVG